MFLIVINILELLAAIAGSFYLKKGETKKIDRLFVYFLWFTIITEIIFGWMPYIILTYNEFEFLRDTFLIKNSWAYNITIIVKFLFFSYYFNSIYNSYWNKVIKFLTVFFLISAIINLIFSDIFFNGLSSYTYITGSILILISILNYFFEVLKSDEILNFNKTLPFYIAIGTLIFHLCMTPLFIYGKYYSISRNPEFADLYKLILTSSNIFMYSCYILGLVISLKNKTK